MKRLTRKGNSSCLLTPVYLGEYVEKYKVEGGYEYCENIDMQEIINKLGKLEDIMEKYDIYDVEDLESYIKNMESDIETLICHKDQAHDIHIKNLELEQDNKVLKKALKLATDNCDNYWNEKEAFKNKKSLYSYFIDEALKEIGEKNNGR